MKYHAPALLISLALVSSAPFAKPAAAQAQGTSPLEQLDVFLGDWTCTGSMMAIGHSPAHATRGKVHAEKALDGHWISIQYDQVGGADSAHLYHLIQYFGYDSKIKSLVDVVVDNSGSSSATGRSSGWLGDKITFENTENTDGSPTPYRDVFARLRASGVSHTGLMRDKNGKWVKTDEESCHRP
jgi:Protein of unknown function (DUF1579)